MTTIIIYALVWGLHALIVLVAFFIVPVNRKPSSATAWLLLITITPVIGFIIFALIGSPKLSRRRRQIQHEMSNRIVSAIDAADDDPAAALLAPPIPPLAHPHAALARRLGGMPPFAGNTVELLYDYDEILGHMAREIEAAQHYVHVEFYIIAMDAATEGFFAAMERAVQRGVKVRLLLDQVGSRSYPNRRAMEARLTRVGVEWRYMLPVGNPKEWLRLDLRNHRKILVVDGAAAYTGSLNVIDRTYHAKGDLRYDELCVRVTGPVVAQLEACFATDWYSEKAELLRPEHYPELAQQRAWPAGGSLCQVLPSGPGFDDENNLRLFTEMIHAAQRRLVIVNPYFVPDEALMLAITSAALRGVKVTLINSEISDQLFVSSAQRSYYERLLLAGVEVLLYRRPTMLHSKSIAVDDTLAVIGSSNLDIRSFTLNLEVSLIIYDPAVVIGLQRVFDGYIANSRPVELAQWRRRPAGAKLMENIARLTAALQ